MKKPLKITLRIFFYVVIIVALYLGVVIGVGVVSDYQPDNITELVDFDNSETAAIDDSVFTLLSWNIGFCGLGAEMDFFYDGGKMVHPTPELVKKYTAGVLNYLKTVDSLDFILLQEVDRNSLRTQKQDEVQLIKNEMPGFTASFAYNYKVKFVPVPYLNPLGKVEMGQLNLSRNTPQSSQRYSFHSAYSWPMRLFMLDRCFVVSRYKLNNGKQLVVMNTHNSAYDAGGKLREIEMPLIRDLMSDEFQKGNYVIAGGDWNQNPPDFDLSQVNVGFPVVRRETLNAELFKKGWQIVYDPLRPTNREIDAPLTKGQTEVTIIDYFILSPNIQLKQIQTLSQNFEFSDHEPVFLKIQIK